MLNIIHCKFSSHKIKLQLINKAHIKLKFDLRNKAQHFQGRTSLH